MNKKTLPAIRNIPAIKTLQAIKYLQEGKFIIVVDHPERENEADLIMAAEYITPQKVAFLINNCSGIICVPMTQKRLQELQLSLMVKQNSDKFQTPFTISVDAKHIKEGGVSAIDRSMTIKTLVNGKAYDLARPGHVFPLQAQENGLLERQGHTEASVDLLKMSRLNPVAVISELMNKDGTMMRNQELTNFSKEHNIPVVSIQDIIQYRKEH